ncbi:TetR/AcrR family transcriptional regulator [Methanobrevibacter sp. TMH8]|uniref:TetR/AcrR family transcriptional regulator n=1 Tax=Methanobrevibacter sp. TMH8 TaxID=2848611 RepID=UPI001CCAB981|nr:TetR/AcrR family transcriptional regulator [Methanobrevibacter sp. TMH8]MBZ9570957.1 TetR/AcrR family transcriptional regulator [Methanobrevibacter sp. TMH8]
MSTKDKIIEAAFLLSLEHGYDNMSIRDIIEESGASYSSIYYHFKNKDDLLKNLIQRYMVDINEYHHERIMGFDGSFIEKLNILFYYVMGIDLQNDKKPILVVGDHIVDFKEYYLMFLGIYHKHPEYRYIFDDLNEKGINFLTKFIEKSIQENEIKKDINSKDLALFITSLLRGSIDIWTCSPNDQLDNIIKTNIEFINQVI